MFFSIGNHSAICRSFFLFRRFKNPHISIDFLLKNFINNLSFNTRCNNTTLISRRCNCPMSMRFSVSVIDEKTYEQLADEALDNLNEKIEIFLETFDYPGCDVMFNDGVLTIFLGDKGVYVINKQTPNKQIWLSSPISGPKRYDYIDGQWIYKFDNKSLHDLLKNELQHLFKLENVQLW